MHGSGRVSSCNRPNPKAWEGTGNLPKDFSPWNRPADEGKVSVVTFPTTQINSQGRDSLFFYCRFMGLKRDAVQRVSLWRKYRKNTQGFCSYTRSWKTAGEVHWLPLLRGLLQGLVCAAGVYYRV